MSRRSPDSLIFDSLRLEGALFVPALLEKAARGEQSEQKLADYQLPKGISFADEQGRAFRIASALWNAFEPVRVRRDVDAHRATIGFVSEFLRDALGYTDLAPLTVPVELAGRHYLVTALARGRVPLIVAPHPLDLDEPDERFAIIGSGSRRKSAYQLAQQFLNASDPCAWAIVTNGCQLRLVRDAATLTRPAFLEFDLELILRYKRYADFAALWRLLHASRAGEPTARGDACIWEHWKSEGEAQGERVRAGLRLGVTDALLALGDGFLHHANNDALRLRLQSGHLSVDTYFQQLLRLVYRFLFLFTIEERGLLHVFDDAPAARRAREVYAEGYALRRMRDRALRRTGFDRYADLWSSVCIVFRGLTTGEPRLALPALGGLFAPTQCPDLDRAMLDNRTFLTVMRHLRWSSVSGALAAIDYRNMGPEELGSVYESLLELVPTVDLPTRRFGFVGLTDQGSSDGNARKMSGSYYTPDSLVQELLKSALDPVIAARLAARPADPAQALLEITVIDPACGSGHFLLGAARRLAERLAELRAVGGAVRPSDYRHALREVIARCIHGVDRNPMAVELARTALWLEGYEPGQPLAFLDHHLVCGDSLLGLTDFKQLLAGISNDAFKPLSGDDKQVCKQLADQNRAALKQLATRPKLKHVELFATDDAFAALQSLEAMPNGTTAEVEAKQTAYTVFLTRAAASPLAQAADMVVAAYLTPKSTTDDVAICPTTRSLIEVLASIKESPEQTKQLGHAQRLCREARVLHWPLIFAQVFGRGGFDCVLGNPPWERIKLQEKEFFAPRHTGIATAQNKAVRDRLIAGLSKGTKEDQRLYREFIVARRLTEASSVFAHVGGAEGGRFPLTGIGDVNTYALFAETISQLTHPHGRSGFIVPTGIATDDSTKAFFAHVVENNRLVCLLSFENEAFIFPSVHHAFKFCLVVIGGIGVIETSEFLFFVRYIEQLRDIQRRFTLKASDFRLINPNTRTCPVFRSQADAELTKKIYRSVPVLVEEARDDKPEKNAWGVSFSRMLDMSNDSGVFLNEPADGTLPLYEAKMMHQFDHRWATYAGQMEDGKWVIEAEDVPVEQKSDPSFAVRPRYWVREREVLGRIARVPAAVAKAWLADDAPALLAAFAVWIESAHDKDALSYLSSTSVRKRVIATGGRRFEELPQKESDWLNEKGLTESRSCGRLEPDDLAHLQSKIKLTAAAYTILDARSPRWLIGWRRNTSTTNERTTIATVIPRAAIGDSIFLITSNRTARLAAAVLGSLNSLPFDFIARQKLGGLNFSFYYLEQLPTPAPNSYSKADLAFIVPKVLELTYTSNDLTPWAADLGYTKAPFGFDPDRRAVLRAELDACYARLYGLTRDELRYILDPADTHGADYPSETFRGLKANEIKAHGYYRTQALVLAAWDAQHGIVTTPSYPRVA